MQTDRLLSVANCMCAVQLSHLAKVLQFEIYFCNTFNYISQPGSPVQFCKETKNQLTHGQHTKGGVQQKYDKFSIGFLTKIKFRFLFGELVNNLTVSHYRKHLRPHSSYGQKQCYLGEKYLKHNFDSLENTNELNFKNLPK